jgi:two-component system NtrC family sensor kinase
MFRLTKSFNTIIFYLICFLFADLFADSDDHDRITGLFQKETVPRLIPNMQNGSGVAFRDINGDDLPDIYLTCYQGNNRLLLNSGAYRPFKDVTQISGLSGNLRPEGVYNFESRRTTFDLKIGAVIIDADNDDDGDIIITGWGISTALYRNDGPLIFKNITDHFDLFPPVDANGCISADIDNDRFPDIFITEERQNNRLLINSGDGFFRDATDMANLYSSGACKGASFSDVDRDGNQDLYVCRSRLPDLFYRNLGNGRFKKISLPLSTLKDSLNTLAVSFGDIDNDADFDMLVTHSGGRNFLYINQTVAKDSQWIFVDKSEEAFGSRQGLSVGSVIADFNNDGFPDFYITNEGPNWLYLNNGDSTYALTIDESHLAVGEGKELSRGAASADFDLDGDIDLFVSNKNSPCMLYMNSLNKDNFIKFKLIGILSNRDAIGARVEIYRKEGLGERDQLLGSREITAGSGYYSLNDPIAHFGLDTIKAIDVRIHFPAGTVIEEKNLPAGQLYTIYEQPLTLRAIILSAQHLNALMQQPSFWYQVLLVLIFFALTFLFVRLGSRRYKWSAGTATGYLIGFFLMALIAITALNKLGLFYIFSIIDLLTIVFVAIFIVNSERLYRLRIIRERYRTVLIDLSNQIVNIRDDQELFQTVIDNITKNTEFDKVAIIPLDHRNRKFDQPIGHWITDTKDNLNNFSDLPELIDTMQNRHYLQKIDVKNFQDYFEIMSSMIFISIERNANLFGILSLGAGIPISPLNTEDIDLFMSIGNQMAIAIENNEYIKRSTEMVKKLTEAEVRERYLKELEEANAVLDSKNRDLQKLYDELKNTQAQLIHSEKMASLGQLVAGISHELNNPIGFIYANIKQLKTYTDKIEEFTKNLTNGNNDQIPSILPDIKNLIEDTIHGSQMVKELVDNLRRFSHLDQAEWKEVDIHEGIESSLMILNPQIKHHIRVEKNYTAKRRIDCNPGQINQVFLNLLANAAQAIEQEGTISIKTSEDEEYMTIEITDDGIGIPANIIDKIFDPFFTTKDVGKGTGLGLSISYSIIKNHGGKIEINSKVGKGSTFTVILPFNRAPDLDSA